MPTREDATKSNFLRQFNDIFSMKETKVEYVASWSTFKVVPRYQFRVDIPKMLLYLVLLARQLQVNMIDIQY